MKYTPFFFKSNMPEWKRKKDPVLSRIFYRPVSFALSSICANLGISANSISYFSGFLAIISCLMFIPKIYALNLTGAILINVWLLLDCTDGNIARSVKKQLMGEFADGISSYILVALMCTCMSFFVYNNGGLLFSPKNQWIILIGALASTADTLMRLIYQKYNSEYNKHAEQGLVKKLDDKRTDHSQVRSFRVRIESELGVGGILPCIILLGTIFNFLDIVVLYCFAYYGGACVITSYSYIKRAINVSKNTAI